MTIFRSRKPPWTSVGVLLVVAVLIAGGAVIGTVALRFDDYRSGPTAASDSNNDDDLVVAAVGDATITARELQEAVLHLQHMKQSAERDLQGLGDDTGLPTGYLQDRHELVLKWGDENVALASLIEGHILHQKAAELGYEVTDQELEESEERARDAYERGALDAYTQGYIDSVGADHYWDKVYPGLAARSMMTGKIQDSVVEKAGTQSHPEAQAHWHDFHHEVVAAADITLPESQEHSATMEGVMGFLNDVRETNRAHLRKDDDLPAAPKETWVIHVKRADREVWDVIHHNVQPEVCAGEDEKGNETHHICDAGGKVLAELGQGDAFVITPPGEALPVFSEGGPK